MFHSHPSTAQRGSPAGGHRPHPARALIRRASVLVASGAMVATALVATSPAGASGAEPTGATLLAAATASPTTGWARTSPMTTARVDHAATRLADGRVLVAGGVNTGAALSSSELYNPATGTWQAAADMPIAVTKAAAVTLPDGTVLVAGGAGTATELYNPTTNVWTTGPRMPAANYSATFAATLPNDHVFVLGDAAADYNPGTHTWTALAAPPAMTRSSNNDTAMVANGDVVTLRAMKYDCCMPGSPITGPSVYHWATNTWATLPVPPVNPGDQGVDLAALPNGNVMLAGGIMNYLWFPAYATTVEEVNPTTGKWTVDADVTFGDELISLPNGSILATGITNDYLYSPTNRTWTEMPGRNGAIGTFTALADGSVLSTGGYTYNGPTPTGPVTRADIFTPPSTSTPPPATHHIGDLDNATTAASSLKKWQPKVTATVLDSSGETVSGATVSGTFSHHKGTLTCVTAVNGTCTLGNFSLSRSTTSTTFRVTDVTKASSKYSATANSDPDGDSNGTTITIKRA
ncbi:MAG: hypothetical protein L0H96_00945 [Humibacillus sp.]|nr:hypothetical protein [Humibacillus sp.]MDN5775465.1 hypothetical protein [Humibacillus sp.]